MMHGTILQFIISELIRGIFNVLDCYNLAHITPIIMSFNGIGNLRPRKTQRKPSSSHTPLKDGLFIASNGYRIEAPAANICLNRDYIESEIDKAEVDSDRYWALIELLGWYQEQIKVKKFTPTYTYGTIT